jgi:hypothetical protein
MASFAVAPRRRTWAVQEGLRGEAVHPMVEAEGELRRHVAQVLRLAVRAHRSLAEQ